MATIESLEDDALYLTPGEQVRPLVWPRGFSARIRQPLRVSPLLDDKGKHKRTSDKRYEWIPQEDIPLIASDGTPLGPISHKLRIEGKPLILTTRSSDAAKTGKIIKGFRRG